MVVERLGLNRRHLLLFAKSGQAERIVAAHIFQQAAHGIGTLVIALGFDGGNEIFLLTLHDFRQEVTVFQVAVQQHFPHKIDHGPEDLISRQGEPILHKTAVQTHGLVIADAAHDRANRRAVQGIQLGSNGTKIRILFGSPQQYGGQKGIHGAFSGMHQPHHLNTQTALLEPPVLHTPQHHSGQ